MKSYFSGMVIGALVGSIMTVLYINNEKEVKNKAKQVKAKSRKATDFMTSLGEDMSDLIKR